VVQQTELDSTITCTGLAGTGVTAAEVTGITLEVFGSVDNPPSSLSITNNAGATNTGYAYTTSEFTVTGVPVGVTLPSNGLGTFAVLAGTCAPLTSSCVSLNSGQSTTVGVSGNANTGALSVLSADLTNYESSFSFLTTTSTSVTASFSGGNVTVTQATTDDLNAQEVITYTVPGGAPEPTTMVLFGSALLGLGCIRKRIRKS
jgi:hypothetical protein